MDNTNEKRCRFTGRISLLVDHELSQNDADDVKRHLADCAVCQKEYDALVSVDRLLRDMSPVAPSEDFARNFWKKVDAVESQKSRWRILNPMASWGWQASLASAAAAVLIMIAAGTIYVRHSLDKGHPVLPAGMPADMLISEDMALYENYEIIQNLDLLENWDKINSIKEI